jgi:hypothetical protein
MVLTIEPMDGLAARVTAQAHEASETVLNQLCRIQTLLASFVLFQVKAWQGFKTQGRWSGSTRRRENPLKKNPANNCE